jgi:hypothetical protein
MNGYVAILIVMLIAALFFFSRMNPHADGEDTSTYHQPNAYSKDYKTKLDARVRAYLNKQRNQRYQDAIDMLDRSEQSEKRMEELKNDPDYSPGHAETADYMMHEYLRKAQNMHKLQTRIQEAFKDDEADRDFDDYAVKKFKELQKTPDFMKEE